MRARILSLALILAVPLVAGAPRVAAAQEEPSASAVKMAQDLVEEGRKLGEQQKWADALEKFKRAAEVSHKTSPQLSFYTGFAESRVGKLVAAAVDLRRAIEMGRSQANDQVASAAQQELNDVNARTPTLTITVNGGTTPSSLSIDGASLGAAAMGSPIPLDPGDHTIVVGFAGGNVTKTQTLAEKQRASLAVDAPPPPPEGATPPPAPSGPSSRSTTPTTSVDTSHLEGGGSAKKPIGIALMVVGGAALVGGGVFFALRQSSLSSLDDACRNGVCPTSAQGDYDDAKSRTTISFVLGGAGIAALAVGIYLFATAPSAATTTTSGAYVSPWIGPGSAGLSGAF